MSNAHIGRLERARNAVAAAERELAEAGLAAIAARIRAAYPKASILCTKGEWNEDMLLRLEPEEVLDDDREVIANSEDAAWAGVFEDDEMYDLLVELAERNAELEGEGEIDLSDPVEVFAPVLLVYGDPAEGFTYVGPVTPNDPELDLFVDTELRTVTWWYVPLRTLANAFEEARP